MTWLVFANCTHLWIFMDNTIQQSGRGKEPPTFGRSIFSELLFAANAMNLVWFIEMHELGHNLGRISDLNRLLDYLMRFCPDRLKAIIY